MDQNINILPEIDSDVEKEPSLEIKSLPHARMTLILRYSE
jgi:hypothetical protein